MEPDAATVHRTATSLGFVVPPGPGPIPDTPITLSPGDREKFLTEFIRQKALVNVDILADLLVTRAVDPDSSVKTLTDTLDANYKLSGLAAKNLAKEVAAAAVSITINMPSRTAAPRVIQGATEVVEVTELTVSPVEATPTNPPT